MGLFSRRKDAAPTRKAVASDFRKKPRRVVHDGYVALLDGQSVEIRDMSEDGVALAIDSRTAPDRGLIELFLGGRLKRRSHALRAWGRGGAVGYKLVDVEVADHAANSAEERALKARAMERRLAAEIGRAQSGDEAARASVRSAPGPSEQPAPGSQGRALRSRLGLS